MSWNKNEFDKQYKRPLKFDHVQWLFNDMYDEQHYRDTFWNYDRNSPCWWQRDEWVDFGNPRNMTELCQYRLLTLLQKLSLKQPSIVIDRIGWW